MKMKENHKSLFHKYIIMYIFRETNEVDVCNAD